MRYEVVLNAPGKCITLTIFASSIRVLAETILTYYHPGTTLVSARVRLTHDPRTELNA